MKKFACLLFAIMVNTLMGGALAFAGGVPVMAGALAANILAPLAGAMPSGVLGAGILTEVWTGEMVKRLRSADVATFLDGLPSYDQFVDNDVIHLVDIGADPDVLVNNSTYPLDIQSLPDGDIALKLDKYETKPTSVTDDELYAISYDKMASTKERHALAIIEAKFAKAIHALAPAAHSAATPVIKTTGTAMSVAEVKGVDTLTISTVPADGDKAIVAGVEYEFATTPATGKVTIGANAAAAAGNLLTAVQADTALSALFTITGSGATIILTQKVGGTGATPPLSTVRATEGSGIVATIARTTAGVAYVPVRKPLVRADIIALKDSFDKGKVPTAGRRLVLCSDHVNDLLSLDQKFADQYYSYKDGKISNMFGFEIYDYISCPYYTSAGAKVAFGAIPGAGSNQASVAFYVKNAFKAAGSTQMYASEAKSDPVYKRNLLSYTHRFVVLPKKQQAIGAIMSDIAPTA